MMNSMDMGVKSCYLSSMPTRNPDSLTNSMMQLFAREMKKQADIDIYGKNYDSARAIMFGLVSSSLMMAPKKKAVKKGKK